MNSFSAVVTADAAIARTAAFEHIVPVDLTSVFTGYGPLPAVIGTENQTGAWDGAGQTRTVRLSDGTSAREVLTAYENPHYFSYRVSGFTGALRFLTTSADGEWWFSDGAPGKTRIRWRYTFRARSVLALPFLWLITKGLWRGYMRKSLRLTITQVEDIAA